MSAGPSGSLMGKTLDPQKGFGRWIPALDTSYIAQMRLWQRLDRFAMFFSVTKKPTKKKRKECNFGVPQDVRHQHIILHSIWNSPCGLATTFLAELVTDWWGYPPRPVPFGGGEPVGVSHFSKER